MRHVLVTSPQFFGLYIWLNTFPYDSSVSAKRCSVRRSKEWMPLWLGCVLSLSLAFPCLSYWTYFAFGEPSIVLLPEPPSADCFLVPRGWAAAVGYGIHNSGAAAQSLCLMFEMQRNLGSQKHSGTQEDSIYCSPLVSALFWGAETILHHEPAEGTNRKCTMSSR